MKGKKGRQGKEKRSVLSLTKKEKQHRSSKQGATFKVRQTDTLPSASSTSAAMAASAAAAASAACPEVVDTNVQPFRSLTLEELDQMEISFSQKENQACCGVARFAAPEKTLSQQIGATCTWL